MWTTLSINWFILYPLSGCSGVWGVHWNHHVCSSGFCLDDIFWNIQVFYQICNGGSSPGAKWNSWFAIFKVRVTMRAHTIKIWLSSIASELMILLQLDGGPPKAGWSVGLLCSKSRSQQRLQISVNIFWTARPFVTTLGMMLHHRKLGCLVGGLDCCGQDHISGSEFQLKCI